MHRRQESEVTRTGSETTYKPERKFSLDVFTFMEMPTLLTYSVICCYTNQLLIIRIDGFLASTNRMIGRIVSRSAMIKSIDPSSFNIDVEYIELNIDGCDL